MNENIMRQDIFFIGNIYFEEVINESEVSKKKNRFKPKNIGECKIMVYGPDEGQIPHFHITSIDGNFKCCVGIYDNHFFSHGNKYRNTLNSKQCKQLNDWLKENNSKIVTIASNWEIISSMWEVSNPDCKYPDNKKCKKQPDYSLMNSFIDN